MNSLLHSQARHKLMRASWTTLAAVGILASAFALELLPLPFLGIALVWLGLLALAMMRVGSTWARAVCFNLACAIVVLAGAEVWMAAEDRFRMEGYDPGAYFRADEILGYALNPDLRVRSQRYWGNELLYDVVYTIDENGLRIAPPVAPRAGQDCILFFGGSFTFGEGVGDEETLPFRTGVLTGGRYRVYNFGLHGYGPHQMLAALESGLVDRTIECSPRFVIYQGIWFHAFRSAGYESWDGHGPRFEVNRQGSVVQQGHFDDDIPLQVRRFFRERLRRSHLLRRIEESYRRPNAVDKQRYFAIVDKTRRIVESRYPGSEFHMVFWDEPFAPIERGFELLGLRLHRVSEMLPADWRSNREKYLVHRRDLHPNALALGLVARYVATQIVGSETGVSSTGLPSSTP